MGHMTHLPSERTKRLERRRLKAGRLFAQGKTQAYVARQFTVSTATTNAWHKAWKKKGESGLLSKGRSGRPPKLSLAQWKNVERALERGPKAQGYATELWTLERIQKLIKKMARVSYHSGHIWRILQDLGWSVQKPETRARERDEKNIKQWMRKDFPRIQKKGSGQGLY
jgi:transposase